ncbi:hypothetical protein BY996DRAFT_6479900 [Phakopsora pachyrhizi]|nr:hypothetical protein BY996DRAFT_6479900 [Phakopsora pachyrhizi]
MDTAEEKAILNVLLPKTPLESILIIKETIDILVSVWNEVSTQAGMNKESQRLTPDDLLYKAAAFSDPLFQTIYALSPERLDGKDLCYDEDWVPTLDSKVFCI